MYAKLTSFSNIVIYSLLFGLSACSTSPNSREKPAKISQISPLVYMSGNDSEVKSTKFTVIRNSDQLKRIKAQHFNEKQSNLIFDVDFSSHILVAVFSGTFVNATNYSNPIVKQNDTEVLIRLTASGYQSAQAERVQLYAFLVLPKSSKRITVEQGFKISIMGEMKWMKVNWEDI